MTHRFEFNGKIYVSTARGRHVECLGAAPDVAALDDAQVDRALAAWFANTKHGWKAAMRAALEAA